MKSGSIYKSLILINKQIQCVGYVYWSAAKDRLANHLLTLIKLHPNKLWNRRKISMNPNITMSIVNANEYDWDWNFISINPNVTWEFIQANPQLRWNYRRISMNSNVTMEIIDANPQFEWDWRLVSRNKNLSINYPSLTTNTSKWCWYSVRRNHNIIKQFIECSIVYALKKLNLIDLYLLFQPRNHYTYQNYLKIVNQNINKIRDARIIWRPILFNQIGFNLHEWDIISSNKYITWEIVQAFPLNPWNYASMAMHNPNITVEIIKANPQYKWREYHFIFKNRMLNLNSLTLDTAKYAKRNYNMTFEIIKKYNMLNNHFELKSVYSENQLQTADMMDELALSGASLNPNTTWETIHMNADEKWNWENISANKFTKSKRKIYAE
jgi:hypothetical protein